MSLIQTRSQWMRIVREAADRPPAGHFAVAATFTADPLAPYLGVAFHEANGAAPQISFAPYNQVMQACFDWQGMFGDPAPTAIVILWRIEDFMRGEFQAHVRGDKGALDRGLDKLAELAGALGALRKSFPGVIVAGIPPFPHSSDQHVRATRSSAEAGAFHRRIVQAWHDRIDEIGNLSVLDLDGIQRHVGIQQSHDDRKWYMFRQPYSEPFWNELGQDLSAVLTQQKVASKKCLVLDCDNTLWGGIVGEDGLAGIAIGEDFPGWAFRDVQQQAVSLYAQGVMLALCSKNNEADVWEVFDKHDGMALKREHIVAHRINWRDKPSNIAELAKELNIGLDSMVFVDDNPMEIEHVRQALPMVTCIQVPSDLAAYPGLIAGFRGFDREKISDEDRARSAMMAQERDRQQVSQALSGEDFRKALELVIDLFEVQPEHVARVTQLTNKTNQFNLTTRRKTAAEITQLTEDPDSHVWALRVGDRFGDYGLVGVIILQKAGETMEVESFLMSCRVLGRGVEESIYAAIAELARKAGAAKVRGRYIPTAKNAMVADLYARYGYEDAGDGWWELADLGRHAWPEHIIRAGL